MLKNKRKFSNSSNSTHTERSVEIEEQDEEDKDWDSEYELEMDKEQRKIIELRMIDMIKWWNDMYRKENNKSNYKLQIDMRKVKKAMKPKSSIKLTKGNI